MSSNQYLGGFTPGLTITSSPVPLYNGPVGIPGMLPGGKRRPAQQGMGFMDNIKKGIAFVKEKKLISKGSDAIGNLAKKNGFGHTNKRAGYNVPKQPSHGFAVTNINLPDNINGNKAMNGGRKKIKGKKVDILIVPNQGNGKAMHGGYGGVIGATKKGSYQQDQRYGLKMGGSKKKIIKM